MYNLQKYDKISTQMRKIYHSSNLHLFSNLRALDQKRRNWPNVATSYFDKIMRIKVFRENNSDRECNMMTVGFYNR